MGKIRTRLGDGSVIELSESELQSDLEDGTQDAAERGKIPPLSQDELRYLAELFKRTDRSVGVDIGKEVVLSYDCGPLKIKRSYGAASKFQSLQILERLLGADTLEMAHVDYSYKPAKQLIWMDQPIMEQALLVTIPAMFYGAMPNLGLYTQPDGPCVNPMELLPQGKIAEARASFEEMVEYAVKDMVFVASTMYEAGADGINFDTTGAAGDGDFLAALRATEALRHKYPDMCIEMGMAGEFIFGMHGALTYDGVRLAGLYPNEQLKLAEKAGASIFGPAVNTNTDSSCPRDVARSSTFIKDCVKNSNILVHGNVGMGVCGIPMQDVLPVDSVSRASKAMVEITGLDGL